MEKSSKQCREYGTERRGKNPMARKEGWGLPRDSDHRKFYLICSVSFHTTKLLFSLRPNNRD